MISTFHGTYNFSNSLKKFYNSIMLRGDVVIAGSKFIFDHIKINYNYKKTISFIPRGIDTNYFSPKNSKVEQLNIVRSRWDVLNSDFVILLPGRLTFWKGQMFFLKYPFIYETMRNY